MSTPDAIAIHPDGAVEELTRPAGEDWLRFLYRVIGTDVVELVHTPRSTVVVDEEGAMRAERAENRLLTQVARMVGGRVAPLFGVGVFTGASRSDFRSLSEGELRAVREAIGDVAGGPH